MSTNIAIPGRPIPIGSRISPGGPQGVPGAASAKGDKGDPGESGRAYTLTAIDPFTVPALGSTVSIRVEDGSWLVPGQMVWIGAAGAGGQAGDMQVTAVAQDPSLAFWNVTLLNI